MIVGVNMDQSILNETNKNDDNFKLSFEIYDWIESIIFSLVTVVLFFTFAFRIVGVQGQSMQQTLQDKDRLILTSYFYEPKHGDVVVVSRKDNLAEPLIKRIIATEGETVNIDYNTNTVYVNGKPVNQPYVNPITTDGDIMRPIDPGSALKLPLTVQKGYVFVMGDNRNNSLDSRFNTVGPLEKTQILGKAVFRIYRDPQFRKSFLDMFGVVK
jgi:signal peptidase I